MAEADIKAACKQVLRITGDAFDDEIAALVEAASADLYESGLSASASADYSDPLVRRAVVTYAKANFGWENPDYERLKLSYDMQVNKLALIAEYRGDHAD